MIKNPVKRYINSRNRVSGTNSSFAVNIDLPTQTEFTHVSCLSASIPRSYYLVQAGYNTFTLRELGQNITITIPVGNYSRTSFRVALKALLDAASTHAWTYTISVPSAGSTADTGKYTYSVTGNGVNQPSFVLTENLYEQLGFEKNSTNTFAANTIVSVNVTTFLLEYTLYIHSSVCEAEQNNVLVNIFTGSTQDLGVIEYRANDIFTSMVKFAKTKDNVFNFSLTDEDGYVMDTNGLNINLALMFFKYEEVKVEQKTVAQEVKLFEPTDKLQGFPQSVHSIVDNTSSQLSDQIAAISDNDLFQKGVIINYPQSLKFI